MAAFEKLTSRLMPLPVNDVDTDQIIPARFLTVIDKTGLGEKLFHDWRYGEDGTPRPDFILNQPEVQDCRILLAGHNFGCGSSREHAPWALTDWGFQAVIALSFADIFRSNALKNGLLPVQVDSGIHGELFRLVEEDGSMEVTVDLERQVLLLPDGRRSGFPIDEFSRRCLMEGIDEVGYLLGHSQAISAFERQR